MEILWIILGSLLTLFGIIGSFLPVIPGPPLSYGGLLLLQFTGGHPFSTRFLIIWAIITAVVMILENVIPALGTERFGGTIYGIGGCAVGLLIGSFLFPPAGVVLGPLLGAFGGEMLAGKSSDQAFRSALGSFVGFLVGTLIKVIASGMMGYYYITTLL